MPKESRRRAFSGQLRRGPQRKYTTNVRDLHLTHGDITARHAMFECTAYFGSAALRSLRLLSSLILLSFVVRHGYTNNNTDSTLATVHCVLQTEQVKFKYFANSFLEWFKLDHDVHDIPLEDEALPRVDKPRQHVRFKHWTSRYCKSKTGFNKRQLVRIYKQFGLGQLAAGNDGNISVYKGANKVSGDPLYYNFHPEELFLFFMTKCKIGYTNKNLCEDIFGGDQSRWSYGWPWILHYIDSRYQDVLSHQGLKRFVDDFPRFHAAIERKVKQDSPHCRNDGSGYIEPGLYFLPFQICLWLDCSIFRTCIPGTGPAGDYIGAPRKVNAYYIQRALYTRYKKLHGIKMETVMLPNGISTLYGPASARASDVGDGVLRMSGLDDFLFEIQQGRPHIYSGFGDSVYGMAGLRCIRSYFKVYRRDAELTEYQKICNKKLKACRQAIEWSYGDISNKFALCTHPRNFKLGRKVPYAQQQLRVCFLLQNIAACLNGNTASGYTMFNCLPPTLEAYLKLD